MRKARSFRRKTLARCSLALSFVLLLVATGIHGRPAVRQHWKKNRIAKHAEILALEKQAFETLNEIVLELDPGDSAVEIFTTRLARDYEPDGHPTGFHRRPYSRVQWSVPVFPFVLLVSDEYAFGPLIGQGHLAFYLDFFVTVVRIPFFSTWIA